MCVKRSIAHICIFQVIFRNRIVINCILELRKLGQRAVTDPELKLGAPGFHKPYADVIYFLFCVLFLSVLKLVDGRF